MKKLLPVILALCANYAHAQILSQNFNSSNNKRTYIRGGTNQFDGITDFKNSKSSIETESGNGFLRFDKIGSSSAILSKNTPLTDHNNLAFVQFKLRISAPETTETPANQLAAFYLAGQAKLIISNINERIVASKSLLLTDGSNYMDIPATRRKGVYMATSQSAEGKTNTKFAY